MSSSDGKVTRGEGVLIARGDPGVAIQIVSPDYQIMASGTGEVEATLPEGVYMVDWVAVGQVSQKVVRLLPLDRPLVVTADTASAPQPEMLAGSAMLEPRSASLEDTAHPSQTAHGSEIAIIVRACSLEEKIDLSVGLRLFNERDIAMRSDGDEAAALQARLLEGYAARLYRAPPGDYRLRYLSMTGEMLDQTIPAFRGRRTVVFMGAGIGTVMMPDGDVYAPTDYQGVDATKTVVVSVGLDAPASELVENARLGEILLHDLAAGGTSLGSSLVSALEKEDADPLLKLYAAAMVISRLDRGASPALDEASPGEPNALVGFVNKWRALAGRWTAHLLEQKTPPDATVLLWRLQTPEILPEAKQRALSSPPMLECSWVWASARSVIDRRAIPDLDSFRAAGRGTGGSAPWLTWSLSMAKAGVVGSVARGAPDLVSVVDAVAKKVREVFDADRESDDTNAPRDLLAFLPPESKAIALRTFEVTEPETAEENRKRGITPTMALAALFGAPAPELKQRLLSTLGDLEPWPPADGTAYRKLIAGSAAITIADQRDFVRDPNKGQFGRRAKRGGLVLSSTFKQTDQAKWVRCDLMVEDTKRAIADGEEVEFFLHVSFNPSRVTAKFRNGKARYLVTAWGGFTLGAWVPSRKVELELDLSKVRGAPTIIRQR